jgi:hypothetical protein
MNGLDIPIGRRHGIDHSGGDCLMMKRRHSTERTSSTEMTTSRKCTCHSARMLTCMYENICDGFTVSLVVNHQGREPANATGTSLYYALSPPFLSIYMWYNRLSKTYERAKRVATQETYPCDCSIPRRYTVPPTEVLIKEALFELQGIFG